ncbi:hypothetical protein HMH01_04785 [Halovulum dunhuangense]|uniref:Uncharacterized protein n=1 Tax=Halovulum dunhuangense TaxID=1505036 RepID=A0A849L0G7_9RHOB|nr:hypothetical protein [Halovulum dunhuangense]NNU79753.1 hypothetical protein [Halovulum dunhuangense]
MRSPLPRALALAALIAAPLAAQEPTAADPTAEPPAEGQAEAPVEAAPPPPDYNGSASGALSGAAFSTQVVCEGFGSGGPVTVKSDPGAPSGEDGNGDGTIVDVQADPSGSISFTLLAGSNKISLSDSGATVTGAGLAYGMTMTFVGGDEERVDLTVTCN